MSGREPQSAERTSLFSDGRYVMSDERVAEIRAMFTERDEWDTWRLQAGRGVTKDDLLAAVYDLLSERDAQTGWQRVAELTAALEQIATLPQRDYALTSTRIARAALAGGQS